MTTTQLSIWNGALQLCKERRLASISPTSESARLLSDAWGDGQTSGVVKKCLERGQWKFATRTVRLDSSPSVEPPFGYQYAFNQPEDMVQVVGIFLDEYASTPLLNYSDERGYWYAGSDPIYASYISNDPQYGADMSLWPETFVDLVEAELADKIVGNLTQGEARKQATEAAVKKALLTARSSDSFRSPTKLMPLGTWATARGGGGHRNSRWNGAYR